jgi:hypothetical protein
LIKIDWNHVELLGWYDHKGKSYSMIVEGNRPMVKVVVTGVKGEAVPLLNAPVHNGAKLQLVPEDRNPFDYAKEKAGFYAIGFYIEEGFERERK